MIETERKYLIADRDIDFKAKSVSYSHIRQGYLTNDPERAVRVRIEERHYAAGDVQTRCYLTVKGKPFNDGASKVEVETEITWDDAHQLMDMAMATIVKVRYHIPYGSQMWEVDVFSGVHSGLIIAELEYDITETFNNPTWVGDDVTADGRYSNQHMAFNPKFFE